MILGFLVKIISWTLLILAITGIVYEVIDSFVQDWKNRKSDNGHIDITINIKKEE